MNIEENTNSKPLTMRINSIGFKNFRKFHDFPSIDLGRLNLLVGTNNSGKSTVIKALIFAVKNCLDVFRMPSPSRFISFKNMVDSHLHLGDFLSNLPEDADGKIMEMLIGAENYRISFVLDGTTLEKGSANLLVPVKEILVLNTDNEMELCYTFSDPNILDVSIRFDKEKFTDLKKVTKSFTQRNKNSGWFDSKKISKYIDDLGDNEWHSYVEHPIQDENEESMFLSEVQSFAYGELQAVLLKSDYLVEPCVMYVEAHNATHDEIVYEEDKNNYLAKTIVDYATADIEYDSKAIPNNSHSNQTFDQKSLPFIQKWMKELGIGDNFDIKRPFSGCLKVDIKSNEKWMPLSSKGTGAIQAFILILNIASALRKSYLTPTIVFIEEPEQNMHPALQSKLADFFLEAIDTANGKLQLVVETHSEYLIRRSQVYVAEHVKLGSDIDVFNQDIKVYYFPKDGLPYDMEFRSSGHFLKKFGNGFFDEASNHCLSLLNLNR